MKKLLRVKLTREKGLYEVLPLKMVKLIKEFGSYEELSFIIDEDGKKIAKKSIDLKGEEFELKTKNNTYKVTIDEEGKTYIEEMVEEKKNLKHLKGFEDINEISKHGFTIDNLGVELNSQKIDIKRMKSDISNIKNDISDIRKDIKMLNNNIEIVNNKVDKLVDYIKENVINDIKDIKDVLKRNNLN